MRLASELGLGQGGSGRLSRETLRGPEDGYAADGSGFTGVAALPAPDRVSAALGPRELLVEYVIPYHPLHPAIGVWILAVDHSGIRLLPTPVGEQSGDFIGRVTVDDHAPLDTSPLGNTITILRSAIQDGDDAGTETALRTLHTNLVAPPIDAGLDPAAFELLTIIRTGGCIRARAAVTDAAGRRLIERTAVALARAPPPGSRCASGPVR